MSIMWSLAGVCLLVVACQARQFQFRNKGRRTIWVGTLNNAGSPLIANGGWKLDPGQTVTQNIPDGWGGRFWGRTGCNAQGGACQTGDCGGGQCSGRGGAPPTTLAEIKMNGDQGNDFYDISLVNGFNIPVTISPTDKHGSGKSCTTAGCTADVNGGCPGNLRKVVGGATVGCQASCDLTHSPQDCCTGQFNSKTCQPSPSAKYFKGKCPDAYSYAYDDRTSTFTCQGTNYLVEFSD